MENKIVTSDCIDFLSKLDSSSIDFVLTSPPYDNLREYNNGEQFDFKLLVKEIFRVLKKDRVFVWVVGDETINFNETNTSFKQARYCKEDVGFKLLDTMIYYKNQGAPIYPAARRYRQSFEYMFVFVKGERPDRFNPQKKRRKGSGEHGSPNFRQRDGSFEQKEINNPTKRKKPLDNVWFLNVGNNHSTDDEIAFKHPAIFPEELAARHIKTWTDRGDKVLDPMCGSGTTLKMAKKYKRDFLGCDISEDYCRISRKRVKRATPVEEKTELSKKFFEIKS